MLYFALSVIGLNSIGAFFPDPDAHCVLDWQGNEAAISHLSGSSRCSNSIQYSGNIFIQNDYFDLTFGQQEARK
jgi:hypothetical protein